MFGRSRRIARAHFPAALSGRRFASGHFSFVIAPAGYAIVVPKKVARLSVTRHRLKRQILAALRALEPEGGLIVFPKASAAALSYQEIRLELAQALKRQAR